MVLKPKNKRKRNYDDNEIISKTLKLNEGHVTFNDTQLKISSTNKKFSGKYENEKLIAEGGNDASMKGDHSVADEKYSKKIYGEQNEMEKCCKSSVDHSKLNLNHRPYSLMKKRSTKTIKECPRNSELNDIVETESDYENDEEYKRLNANDSIVEKKSFKNANGENTSYSETVVMILKNQMNDIVKTESDYENDEEYKHKYEECLKFQGLKVSCVQEKKNLQEKLSHSYATKKFNRGKITINDNHLQRSYRDNKFLETYYIGEIIKEGGNGSVFKGNIKINIKIFFCWKYILSQSF